jgi:Mannosyltransferase (PIG-V)
MPKLHRVADAASVAFLLLGLFVLLFGASSVSVGPWPIRISGADRLLFVAVAIAAVRHAAHPADPLHERLARLAVPRTESAAATRVALISRAAVLFAGYLAVITIGLAGDTTGFTVSGNPVLNLPARFDAGWYGTIALEGYSFQGRFDRQQNVAFFPAFPMLERIAGYPFGAFAPHAAPERRLARLLWAGVAIAIAAFTWAAVYLWRLARDTIGEDRALDAVAFLAAYPFAVYFSAAYTESLFLLGTLAAFYHFRRGELARAAAWGLLVGLTRPNGCLLAIVLAVDYAVRAFRPAESREGRREGRPERLHYVPSLAAAAAPAVGMLIFSAYVKHLTGAWFGWARLHETWGRTYSGLTPLVQAYTRVSGQGLLSALQTAPYDAMNAGALLFACAMVWPVFRRLGLAAAVLVLVTIVPPLMAGGVLSMGRITSTAFPLFLALAAVVPRRAVTSLVTACAIVQGLVAALFFTWRPLF